MRLNRDVRSILGLSGISFFLIHLLLSVVTRAQQSEIRALRTVVQKNPTGSLSCGDVYRIGAWSAEKHGGSSPVDLGSTTYAQSVLEAFIEKLDPARVLFIENQVGEFRSRMISKWKETRKRQDCKAFESWANEIYPSAKERFQSILNHLPVTAFSEVALSKTAKGIEFEESDSSRLIKFTNFAKSEAELKIRIELLAQRVIKEATPRLISAYQGDRRLYVIDTLDQWLFESDLNPRTALAKAMLSALDHYSAYFTSQEFEDFYSELAGGTSGIGIRVRRVPRGFLIEKIMPDSPASESKSLREGDVIVSVDGVQPMSVSSAASKKLLRGMDQSRVVLEIERGKETKKTVTLVRRRFEFEEAKIKAATYSSTWKGQGPVAVIDVPSFYGRGGMDTASKEKSVSQDLSLVLEGVLKKNKKPSAVVLDLRGNPGGFLEEAVSMAGLFIADNPVVTVVEGSRTRVLRDSRARAMYRGPLVVLVDDQSASAAEVFAGAMKDLSRAVIVGSDRTYGKGSVQKLFHLDDEFLRLGFGGHVAPTGVVKLTTSLFYTPLGHSPLNGGVKTDIALPLVSGGPVATGSEGPKNLVPEISPSIDDWELRKVKVQSERMEKKISALESRSQRRLEHLGWEPNKFWVSDAVKQGVNEDEESNLSAEQVLNETIAIASDLAQLEQLVPRRKLTLKATDKNYLP